MYEEAPWELLNKKKVFPASCIQSSFVVISGFEDDALEAPLPSARLKYRIHTFRGSKCGTHHLSGQVQYDSQPSECSSDIQRLQNYAYSLETRKEHVIYQVFCDQIPEVVVFRIFLYTHMGSREILQKQYVMKKISNKFRGSKCNIPHLSEGVEDDSKKSLIVPLHRVTFRIIFGS